MRPCSGDFGAEVRRRRQAVGATQADLAAASGMTQCRISIIERTAAALRAATRERVLLALAALEDADGGADPVDDLAAGDAG